MRPVRKMVRCEGIVSFAMPCSRRATNRGRKITAADHFVIPAQSEAIVDIRDTNMRIFHLK